MFDPQKLTNEEYDQICDYALELYSYSATESLYFNNHHQYQELFKLSQAGNQLNCALEGTALDLDPEECGEGDLIRVTLSYSLPEDGEHAIDVADVYFSLEGMQDKLGTVVWFPKRDSWR